MTVFEAQSRLIQAQQDYIAALLSTGAETSGPAIRGFLPEFNQKNELPLYRDYSREFIEEKKRTLTLTGYGNYSHVLRVRILPFLGDMRLNEISATVLQNFIDHLAQHYSPKTIKDTVMLAREVLYYAEKKGMLSPSHQPLCYPREDREEYRILTDKEFATLRAYILGLPGQKRIRSSGVLIAMETGLRIGEVCGLKWEDIDLENRTLSVVRSVKRPLGAALEIGKPKTPASRRRVILTKLLASFLGKLERKDGVFVVTGKEKPTEPRTYREHFFRLCRAAGVPKVTFHSLRHGFATRCIESGIDPKSTAALMGHTKCDITLDIYTNCTEKMKRKAMEILEKSESIDCAGGKNE